jgi:hypothetical protein
MYPVTTEFQEKITDPKNRKVFARLEIDYTSISMDESITITTNEEANVSYANQVADSVNIPYTKILSLDGSCSLDGSYGFAPTEQESYLKQMGWWGSTLSGVDGSFTSPYPTISVEFNPRPITRFTVVGDSKRAEYPVDFNIYLYDSVDTLLYTKNIVGNTSINYLENLISPVTNVAKLSLEVTKWSHDGRQVKIYELYTSIREVYENEEIISMDLIEEREVSDTGLRVGTISNNQLSFKLDNSSRKFDAGNSNSPLYGLLRPNRRVKGYLGIMKDIEWSDYPDYEWSEIQHLTWQEYINLGIEPNMEYVPLGVFWTDEWDVPENMAYAQTIALDKLKFFEETEYVVDTVLSDVSLYDLAEDVLLDYGLTSGEYFIEPSLADIVIPYVYFPDGISHKEILTEIAEAGLGYVGMDRLGILRIEGMFPSAEVYNISVNEDNTVSCINQLTDGIEESESLYIMLDGQSSFDGTYELPEDDCSEQIGWIGTSVSGIDGSFSSPYPTATLTFQSKSVASVVVVGDNLRNEYPVDFNIRIYDDVDTLLSEQNITGNTELSRAISIPENPTNAVKIVLEITKWSESGTAIKVIEFVDKPYKLSITNDEYFRKNNPVRYNELANIISVEYTPMDGFGDTSDSQYVVVSDESSIELNGRRKYEMRSNPLIQTSTLATSIGNTILSYFTDPQRNLELEWRGNPALLLGDTITVIDDNESNDYRITSQTLNYAGVLRAKLNARKVLE